MKVWVVLVRGMAFLAGCTSNETNDNEKRGPANEETRFVTQMVTVEETTVVTEAPSVSPEQPPEDVLALQYEYINGGDFEEAYLLNRGEGKTQEGLLKLLGLTGIPMAGTRKPTPKNRDW
jgi:hypothetical protein